LVYAIIYFMFLSLTGPAYNKIVQDVYPIGQRGKTMAVVRLGFTFTLLIFSPIAGWLLDQIGYSYLFPLGAVFGIGSVMALARMRIPEGKNVSSGKRTQRSAWKILLQEKELWVYWLVLVIFGLGALIPITLIPIIQVDILKLTYSQIGLLTLAQNITWFFGFYLSGRMVDRIGGLKTTQIGIFIHIIILLPYLWARSGWGLIPAFLASGLASALIEMGFMNGLMQLSKPDEIIHTSSIQSTVIGIRGLVGPYIGVWLAQIGLSANAIIWISTVLLLVSFLLMFRFTVTINTNKDEGLG